MPLIFDSFPSREKAEAFAAAIRKEFGIAGQVFDDRESIQLEQDWFPYGLFPPIVHIDRSFYGYDWMAIERAIEVRVEAFGGTFAGT